MNSTLHTSRSSYPILISISHFKLHIPHFTLHISHFTFIRFSEITTGVLESGSPVPSRIGLHFFHVVGLSFISVFHFSVK